MTELRLRSWFRPDRTDPPRSAMPKSGVLGPRLALTVSRAARSEGHPGPLARHLHGLSTYKHIPTLGGRGGAARLVPREGLSTGYPTVCLRRLLYRLGSRGGRVRDRQTCCIPSVPARDATVSLLCVSDRRRRRAYHL